jgi:hypothetical protein
MGETPVHVSLAHPRRVRGAESGIRDAVPRGGRGSEQMMSLPKFAECCEVSLAVYKSTHCGQHAHPKMSCMDLIHLRVGIYLDNCYWWIHIRYLYTHK